MEEPELTLIADELLAAVELDGWWFRADFSHPEPFPYIASQEGDPASFEQPLPFDEVVARYNQLRPPGDQATAEDLPEVYEKLLTIATVGRVAFRVGSDRPLDDLL